jgi:hypothetical protein
MNRLLSLAVCITLAAEIRGKSAIDFKGTTLARTEVKKQKHPSCSASMAFTHIAGSVALALGTALLGLYECCGWGGWRCQGWRRVD